MAKIKNIVRPKNIDEAYELYISKKSTRLIGGGAFTRLSKATILTGIDLDVLDLNYIKETQELIEIGAMTTLREIETSSLLIKNFSGILPKSVLNIVGVQFRNIATIGASVAARYSFSDIITALLCLNTTLIFHNLGEVSLEEYLKLSVKPRDILIKLIIKKDIQKASYQMIRNSESDFPILNVSVSQLNNDYKICFGARPNRATFAYNTMQRLSKGESIESLTDCLLDEIEFNNDLRASEEYRKLIAPVLVKRALEEVL